MYSSFGRTNSSQTNLDLIKSHARSQEQELKRPELLVTRNNWTLGKMWLLLMTTLPETTERMRQTLCMKGTVGTRVYREVGWDKVRCMVNLQSAVMPSTPVLQWNSGIWDAIWRHNAPFASCRRPSAGPSLGVCVSVLISVWAELTLQDLVQHATNIKSPRLTSICNVYMKICASETYLLQNQ